MGIGAVRTKRGGYFSVHVNGLWPVNFQKYYYVHVDAYGHTHIYQETCGGGVWCVGVQL